MSKLILLNEVRAEKIKNKNKLPTLKANHIEEDHKNSYITFKEKFSCLQNKEELIDLNKGNNGKINNSNIEKNLNKIMERIFLLGNHTPLIDLINSIYNDDLSIGTKIKFIKNKQITNNNQSTSVTNSNYNIKVLAEDEYKKFEYKIQFQTKDEQNIGIIITKKDLSGQHNILSLNSKRREYINVNNSEKDYSKCLIMLNSNIEVPDIYEFTTDCKGQDVSCKINIIKSWKYDFKQLIENKMYLLIPVKVIDFIKLASMMSNDDILKEQIKDEIIRFYKDMNRHLNKIKEANLITEKDSNELNIIAVDLLNEFIREKKNDILIDIKRDIAATLKEFVV